MKQRFEDQGDSNREARQQWPTAPSVTVTVRAHGSEPLLVGVSSGLSVRDALERAGFQARDDWEVWFNGRLADFNTPIPVQEDGEIIYRPRVVGVPVDPQRLIEFIVWYATRSRGQLSRLRLMKFLYLSDWLSVRRTGHRLTGYPWCFYHYGPYAAPAQQDIDAAVAARKITVEQISDAEDKDVYLYRRYGQDPELWQDISADLEARLRGLIDQWIHRPRNEFLDFVYFATEPMHGARRGELLDFRTVQWEPQPPSPLAHAPQQRSAVAQAAFERFLAHVREARPLDPPPVYDELYDRALSLLDEQDLPRAPLRGEVELGSDAGLRTSE